MADYLKNFETTEEYEEYIDGDFLKPNVSYLIDNNQVRYNPVTPSGDGGLANILSKPQKMLTYLGKIITTQDRGLLLRDEDADNVVANDVPWSTIWGQTLPLGVPLNFIRNDDGTEINVETQCVDANDVPADTVFVFVLEPAFYTTQ